jgi:hypothetical protein
VTTLLFLFIPLLRQFEIIGFFDDQIIGLFSALNPHKHLTSWLSNLFIANFWPNPSIPINIQEETSFKILFVKEKHGFLKLLNKWILKFV